MGVQEWFRSTNVGSEMENKNKYDVRRSLCKRREGGTLGCLLHKSPKFYNNVLLFVGSTTVGTFIIEF